MTYQPSMKAKKYILKPGRHQFAPAGCARHDNDSLTNEEAAWYLERYPHIKQLFVVLPEESTGLESTQTKNAQTSESEVSL